MFDPVTAIVGGSILGAGASIFGTLSAADAASEAGSRQDKLLQLQAEVEREKLKMSREQWERYLSMYGPVEEAYQKQVLGLPISPMEYAEPEIQDINKAYASTLEANKQAMANRGMYGSGLDIANDTNIRASAASARARALSNARTQARREKSSEMATFVGLGKGLPATALAGMGSVNYGGIGAQYGANMAAASQAAGNWANLGYQSFNALGQGISNYFKPAGTGISYNPAMSVYSPSDYYSAPLYADIM